jgi:hypothetical protein
MTDVWSRIRKDSAKFFAQKVLPVLLLSTIEDILMDHLNVCKSKTGDESEWKAVDGAFWLLANILAMVEKIPSGNNNGGGGGFRLGKHVMPYLPACLLSDLKPVRRHVIE